MQGPVPKGIRIILIVALIASATGASAWGVRIGGSSGDLIADALPVAETGEAAYDTQEGAHDSVTLLTGVAVDHYYIDVCTGDECIPVDPFTFDN